MNLIYKVIFGSIVYILTFLIVFYSKNKFNKYSIIDKITKNKISSSILEKYNELINEIYSRQLFSCNKKVINIQSVLIISTILFVIMLLLCYKITKILSTSLILASQTYVLPYLILKYLIDNEKKQMLYILPSYIVNLKNYIQQENNIIAAMKNVPCVQPLEKYIKSFNMQVERGMNVKKAIEELKKQVGIVKFSELLSTIEACYSNGGNFENILNKYIEIISKENIHKEKIKEKAYSSVIILCIMIVINIYLVFSFILSNQKYANIIQNSIIGRIILDINAISYILIGYIVLKIYRTGEKI